MSYKVIALETDNVPGTTFIQFISYFKFIPLSKIEVQAFYSRFKSLS